MTVFRIFCVIFCVFVYVPVFSYPIPQSFNDERYDSAAEVQPSKATMLYRASHTSPSVEGDFPLKGLKGRLLPNYKTSFLRLDLPATAIHGINPAMPELDSREKKISNSTADQNIFKGNSSILPEPEEYLTYFTNELSDLRSSTTEPNVEQNQKTGRPPIKLLQKLLRNFLFVGDPKEQVPKPPKKNSVVSIPGSKILKTDTPMKAPVSTNGQYSSLLNTLNVILRQKLLPSPKTYRPLKILSKNISSSKFAPDNKNILELPNLYSHVSPVDTSTKTSFIPQLVQSTIKITTESRLINAHATPEKQQISSTTPKTFEILTDSPTILNIGTISPLVEHEGNISMYVNYENTFIDTPESFQPCLTNNFETNETKRVPDLQTTSKLAAGSYLCFQDMKSSTVPPFEVYETNEIEDTGIEGAMGSHPKENVTFTTDTQELDGNDLTGDVLTGIKDVDSQNSPTILAAETEEIAQGDLSFETSSLMNDLVNWDTKRSKSTVVANQLESATQHHFAYSRGDEDVPTMPHLKIPIKSADEEDSQQSASTFVPEGIDTRTPQPEEGVIFGRVYDITNSPEHGRSLETDSIIFESTHPVDSVTLGTSPSVRHLYTTGDVSGEPGPSTITTEFSTLPGVLDAQTESETLLPTSTLKFESDVNFTPGPDLTLLDEHEEIIFETTSHAEELINGGQSTVDGASYNAAESSEHTMFYEHDGIVIETSTRVNDLLNGDVDRLAYSTEITRYSVLPEHGHSNKIVFETSTRVNNVTSDGQITINELFHTTSQSSDHRILYEHDFSDESTVLYGYGHSLKTEIAERAPNLDTNNTTSHFVHTSVNEQLLDLFTTHNLYFEPTRDPDRSTIFEKPLFEENSTGKEFTVDDDIRSNEFLSSEVTVRPIYQFENTSDTTHLEYNLILDKETHESATITPQEPIYIPDDSTTIFTGIHFEQTVVDESWIQEGESDVRESQDTFGTDIFEATTETVVFKGSTFLIKNGITLNETPENYHSSNENGGTVTTVTVTSAPDSQTEKFTMWTDLGTKNGEPSTDTQFHKTTTRFYYETTHNNLLLSTTDSSTIFSSLGSTDHVTEEENLGLFLDKPTGGTTGKESAILTTFPDTSITALNSTTTQTTEIFYFTDEEEEEADALFECVTQSSSDTSTQLITTSQSIEQIESGSGASLNAPVTSVSSTPSGIELISEENPIRPEGLLVQDDNNTPKVFDPLETISTTTEFPQPEKMSNLDVTLTGPGMSKDHFDLKKFNLSMKNYATFSKRPKYIQASESIQAPPKSRAEKLLNLLSGELFVVGTDSEENNEAEEDPYEVDESGMKIVKNGQRKGKWIENMSNDDLMALIESIKLKHARRS